MGRYLYFTAFLSLFSSLSLAAQPSFLKCEVNEVTPSGTRQSLFMNSCGVEKTDGSASVTGGPDDDFDSVPTFKASLTGGKTLSLSMKPFGGVEQSLSADVNADQVIVLKNGNLELNCSVTTNTVYANGLNTCDPRF